MLQIHENYIFSWYYRGLCVFYIHSFGTSRLVEALDRASEDLYVNFGMNLCRHKAVKPETLVDLRDAHIDGTSFRNQTVSICALTWYDIVSCIQFIQNSLCKDSRFIISSPVGVFYFCRSIVRIQNRDVCGNWSMTRWEYVLQYSLTVSASKDMCGNPIFLQEVFSYRYGE